MRSVYRSSDGCKNPLDHLAGQTVSSVQYKERAMSLGWSQEPWAVLSVCARPRGIPSRSLHLSGPGHLHFTVNTWNWRIAKRPSIGSLWCVPGNELKGKPPLLGSTLRKCQACGDCLMPETLVLRQVKEIHGKFHQGVPVLSHTWA